MSSSAAADDTLAAALSGDLAIRLRACPESVAIDGGWVVRSARLACVHQLNAIVLGTTAPLPGGTYDPGAIETLTRRWQAQQPDQCIVIDDEPAARRLGPALGQGGWERQRTLLLALDADASAVARDSRARELSEDELRSLQLACLREEVAGPGVPGELPRLLADAQATLRASTPSLRFGAGQPGAAPASTCTLFLNPDVDRRRVATVDAVATLREQREQGLARAAVSMALDAAREWGADLVTVAADADDWPQLMYLSLGFRPLGRRWQFVRRASLSLSGGVASAR